MSASSTAVALQDSDISTHIHPIEFKTTVLIDVLQSGSLTYTANRYGINHKTIAIWMLEPWASDIREAWSRYLSDRMDMQASLSIDNLLSEIDDRVTNGDELVFCVTNQGDHELVRTTRKVSGKDLAFMLGILYDKRALSRGQPTTITHVDKLKELADMLRYAGSSSTIDQSNDSSNTDSISINNNG